MKNIGGLQVTKIRPRRVRHFVPVYILLSVYCSLILPYLSYGLASLNKLLKTIEVKFLYYKNAIGLVHFCEPRAHAVPLFISSNCPPLRMLYFEAVSSIMLGFSSKTAPSNITDLFYKSEWYTMIPGFFPWDKFYIKTSRLNQSQGHLAKSGEKLWNTIHKDFHELFKGAFKKTC